MAIEFVGCQEAFADEAGFHAEDAIEFDGMPARFVDLKGDLGAIKNDGCDATGTLWGGKQFDSFFANAGTVVGQVHGLDEFVAGCSGLATKGVGVGTSLYFAAGGVYG